MHEKCKNVQKLKFNIYSHKKCGELWGIVGRIDYLCTQVSVIRK